jgi:putative endonuclease
MYYIYALTNKAGRVYVGMSKDVEKRLEDHNKGRVFSTKGFRPWTIFFQEKVGNREEARKREKYYKSGYGKEFLKTRLSPL